MQDRYVGDAGDFAKYSLLMALSLGEQPLRLGINWYFFPDENHNSDGRHIGYLKQPLMAGRDAKIHAALGRLVTAGRRSLAAVERSRILPEGSIFFRQPVSVLGAPGMRETHRRDWFRKASRRLAAADIMFFDPDNGLETPALDRRSFKAGKYVFWSEIETAWETGHSLVVYNHLNRSAPAAVQTMRLYDQFAERLQGAPLIMPLLFRRGSCRHLWVIAQPRHQICLERRVRGFLDRGWSSDSEVQFLQP